MKKRILTGDTPTGKLHIGHYVGTLKNRVALQDEYEEFIILADTHALSTLSGNPRVIQGHTLSVLLANLAVGLDPEKVHFFAESLIPEIYEMAAIFSMYVSHNRALRNPTVKDEITMKGLGDRFSLGFVNYPIFQAADILCVKADLVPVGKDQEAHIEQTRELAREMNRIAGSEVFPEPEGLIGEIGKLVGTDGNPKMGKSLGNTIYLGATTDEIKEKVMSMYTDPNRIHASDPGKVEGNPVFIYLDAFKTPEDEEQIAQFKQAYTQGHVGDVEVKTYLVGVLDRFMAPIRERMEKYNNEKLLLEILHAGSKTTQGEAQKNLEEVKKIIGFVY